MTFGTISDMNYSLLEDPGYMARYFTLTGGGPGCSFSLDWHLEYASNGTKPEFGDIVSTVNKGKNIITF